MSTRVGRRLKGFTSFDSGRLSDHRGLGTCAASLSDGRCIKRLGQIKSGSRTAVRGAGAASAAAEMKVYLLRRENKAEGHQKLGDGVEAEGIFWTAGNPGGFTESPKHQTSVTAPGPRTTRLACNTSPNKPQLQ